ncbi:hypothetical protein [Streptacidiphilus melanogenes]|uniref:hypothetical protein n=1 Tax=Streptacidiphilus melanogenes TaxID=411235 RepID=UPI0005A999DA|nr:hypothetical protein [Streptacidiphilus melanogenes]
MSQSFGQRVHGVITAGSVSLNIALSAGIVMYALGASRGEAVATGGGAFVVVMGVALSIMAALRQDGTP